MGVNLDTARYLIAARKAGVSFERTLTLGRQWLCAKPDAVNALLARAGFPSMRFDRPSDAAWADAFFRALGATQLDVLDHSAYEGATVLHDLNQPLPAGETRRYDVVFDGGVIEHVFDCANAFRSCMQLTKVGGHLCVCSIANNECGHGFYQFSPELFFRLFDTANGFTLRSVLVEEQRLRGTRWYAVTDPAALGARVVCINGSPLHIKALARKEQADAGRAPVVIQADYQRAWRESEVQVGSSAPRLHAPVSLKAKLVRSIPNGWVGPLKHAYRNFGVTRLHNRRFFAPVDLDCPPFAL